MKNLIVPILMVLILGSMNINAQEHQKEEPKTKKAKEVVQLDLSDAVKRGYKKAHEDDEFDIVRFHVCKGWDDDGNKALICIVEYSNGDMGLHLGSRVPGKDNWIKLEKTHMSLMEDVAHRLK